MPFRTRTAMLALWLAAAPTATTAAWAYQPLISDDSGTQGKGGNQLELALERDRSEQAGIASVTRLLPVTLTHGLSDTLDAFVGISHIRLSASLPGSEASGGGNPVLGLKWRFHEDASGKTSFAFKPQYSMPTSAAGESAGLGSGRGSWGLTAILTRETAFGAFHANLVASNARHRDSASHPDSSLLQASVASVWHLGDDFKLALDLGTRRVSDVTGRNRTNHVEIGGIYSPDKDLDFALGLIRSVENTSPRAHIVALTGGITWRFR